MPIGDWLKGKVGEAGSFLGSPEGRLLMAGIGTGLDPKGVGGAIGRPTGNMLRARELRRSTDEQRTAQKEWQTQLLNLLGMMTGPGKEGGDTSSIKVDKDGRFKMNMAMDLGIMKDLFKNFKPSGQPGGPGAPGLTPGGLSGLEDSIWK